MSGKYSGIGMAEAWAATIAAPNQQLHADPTKAKTQSVSVGSIGCSASWINECVAPGCGHTLATETHSGPPLEHEVLDPPPPGYPEDATWHGEYYPFTLNVSAPGEGNSDKEQYWVWAGDICSVATPPPMPEYGTVISEITADVVSAITGMYPKGERTDNGTAAAQDRQIMDETDLHGEQDWYADESAEVTISAGNLSVSGPLADAGAEMEIGNTWALAVAFNINDYRNDAEVYARISDITFGGIEVDLTNLNLYNPGSGVAPDATNNPNWKRAAPSSGGCARITDDGGIATWWTGDGNAGKSWSGTIWAPFKGRFVPKEGGHEDATAYNGTTPVYYGPCIAWTYDSGEEEWVWAYESWTGTKSYYQQQKSWEFTHEWQTLAATSAIAIYQYAAWRAAAGEAVGDSTPQQNDQQLGILMRMLNAQGFTGEPWDGPFVTLSHLGSVDVDIPPGLASRPSLWTGSGGTTVDPGDNTSWTVPASTSAPKVERSFVTRRWLRFDRLAGGSWIEGAEYHPDWTIMGKANLAIGTTLDDPDWWDSGAGGVDAEDVTQWSEYAYLRLQLSSPIAGTATVTVDYSVPAPSDPCYTCASGRWAEYEYTRSTKQLSYRVTLAAGSNDKLIDLCLPQENTIPVFTSRMAVIDKVTIALPANTTGSGQTYTLGGLELIEDPGEGERAEPAGHVIVRYKRAWDWIGADWCGLGAIVDGKDALEVDYGYDSSYAYTRHQHQMLYIARSEHCPGSEATVRLDAAKPIARLVQEVNYQEGWEATDHEVVDSALNKDSEDNTLCGAFYWWDLKQNHEYEDDGGSIAMLGAPCVGTIDLLAGIEQDHHFYNVPRGRLHGIAVKQGGGERKRGETGVVTIYEHPAGGTWSTRETRDTNDHGRYRSTPLLEKDVEYRAGGYPAVHTVANREYSTAHAIVPEPTRGQKLAMMRHPMGNVPWTVWIEGNDIKAAETASGLTSLGTIRTVDSSGDYDTVAIETDGDVIYVDARSVADERPDRFTSRDHGATWTGPVDLA